MIQTTRAASAALFTLSFAAILACSGANPDANSIVAEIEGVSVTQDELDDWIKEDLFAQQVSGKGEAALFEMRSDALDNMIRERVLKAMSERQNLEIDALIEQEIESAGGVTEEEITKFYEENKARFGEITLDDMRPRIENFLERSHAREAIKAITARADVVVHLVQPRVEVAADGPALGPDDAPVTIVEFSDFQCPFCAKAGPVLKEVREKYPDQVRIVYRHLPLESIHPRAHPAAEASACADEQGQFWAYHDVLFENTRKLEDADLLAYAAEVELDVPAFEACVADERFEDKVDDDADAARAIGISGTPAFVINGIVMSGALPIEEFVTVIDAELALLAADESGGESGDES